MEIDPPPQINDLAAHSRPINQNAPNLRPSLDLDPTTNDQLHRDLWARLKTKIEIEMKPKKVEELAKEHVDDVSQPLPSHSQSRKSRSKPSPSRERRFGQKMRRLTKLICKAFLNPIYIPWDIEEFYIQHVRGGGDKKREEFPNPQFGLFSEPLTVVDAKGRIVLWYLPDLLSEEEETSIRLATNSIGPLLRQSVKKEKPKKPAPNWRIHHRNFVRKSHRHHCEPGAVNFSSGWFGLGHETKDYPLLPSLNIRTRTHLGPSKWIDISNGTEIFLNLTLSLINPDLFQTGLQMLLKLRQLETTRDVARKWQSVYNGISIIVNRRTPSHRDKKGRPEWYDTLVSYSARTSRPRLSIKDIGLDLKYSSGTVVSFCGMILKHEVSGWGIGDRVCYAHFLRESVRERLDVNPAGWVNRGIYLPINL